MSAFIRCDPASPTSAPARAGVNSPRPHGCTVRAATRADAPRLAAFAAGLFRQAYGPTHPEPTLSHYLAAAFAEETIAERLEAADRAFLVAEAADGEWAGYAELRAGEPTDLVRVERPLPGRAPLEIVRFYVERAWHGRGVAQRLMAACDTAARARGADVLWLQAWQEATQAVRFYAKAGFAVHGTAIFQFGERADRDFLLARPVADAQGEQPRVVGYRREFRDAFEALNREWIEAWFEMEPRDVAVLRDPEREIVSRGGEVFFAIVPDEQGLRPVGTCALTPIGDGAWYLGKMAVAAAARGQGHGERLLLAALAWARTRGARRIELTSNRRLEAALALYRKHGFREVPLDDTDTGYARVDIRMMLDLSGDVGGEAAPRA